MCTAAGLEAERRPIWGVCTVLFFLFFVGGGGGLPFLFVFFARAGGCEGSVIYARERMLKEANAITKPTEGA